MAERILEFLSNLLKIGKDQLFLKSSFLRNKVPIKPVLGLTGLGVLFMAVRPLLTKDQTMNKAEPKIENSNKPEEQYDVRRTFHLMQGKEKELRSQDGLQQKS